MEFFNNIHEASLHAAVKKGNMEIVKFLLSQTKIDINCKFILYFYFFHGILN